MKHIEQFVKTYQHQPGVRKIELNGEICWLKISGEEKSNFIRKCSAALSKLSHLSILETQSVSDSYQRFEHEKTMLQYLRQHNFSVPDIHYEGERYFITPDHGTPIHKVNANRITDEVLFRVFQLFLDLHQVGIAHGRPAMRDIVLNENDQPTLLDFEESIFDATPANKARDIYMLLLDLNRIEHLSVQSQLQGLTHWRQHVAEEDWQSLMKIHRFVKTMRCLPRLILHFKPSNRLSQQLIRTTDLLEQM